jgi:alanine racemase
MPRPKSPSKRPKSAPAAAPVAQLAPHRPAWAEVSASALRGNYEVLRDQAAEFDAGIIAVIKANAYGHGVAQCAQVLAEAGAEWFAITSVDEGMEVVQALGSQAPRILVLSGVFDLEDARRAIRYRLTPVLLSLQQVEWLAEAARLENSSDKLAFHLEIDTGMARNGVRWDDTAQMEAIAALLAANSNLRAEGVLTHFASPDEPASPQNAQQIQRFQRALAHLHALGVRPALVHAGNSFTLFDEPRIDSLAEVAQMYGAGLLLRPGLALYGYGAGSAVAAEEVKPVLTWKSRVTNLRRLQAGDGVSYNATFHTMRATTVATLATGYADGYNRLLSNKGTVLIRGQRAAVLGRVTMDQIMVDVTQIEDVAVGDEAVLLGTQGDFTISAGQIATLTGTIPWEVLCAISARVARVLTE